MTEFDNIRMTLEDGNKDWEKRVEAVSYNNKVFLRLLTDKTFY